MRTRHTLIALAAASLFLPAHAQQAAGADAANKLDRVQITGSLIKRVDRETPSVVQSITAEDIKSSGYATVEDLLRSIGAVDVSSVSDGIGTGFVSGVSTISLRGFGSQGTLTLINGRRIAPAAAVDVNFGRGNLINVNTIPKGALERVDILKDGASAIYGSDAVVGVVNYVLKKEYVGLEGNAGYTAAPDGIGANKNAGLSFGFGNLDTQRFNVFGGLEVSRRDPVSMLDLKDRGDLDLMNRYQAANGSYLRHGPDSVASPFGNYYSLPTSLSGSTVINGVSIANSSIAGKNFLGSLGGCPDALTVGKGVPNVVSGSSVPLPTGMCRFALDDATQVISAQDRVGGTLRGTFLVNQDLTAYADLMLARVKTEEMPVPQSITTSLATSGNPNIVTWPRRDGSMIRYPTIVLPVGHPDNPTNGKANAQPVQLLYRFVDLDQRERNQQTAARFSAGILGTVGAWDLDSSFIYSYQGTDNSRDRISASKLSKAISSGSYRFGKVNDAAAIASVTADARTEGKATITSADLRASREWFSMAGGKVGVAVGAEARRETLEATPNQGLVDADFIGLVANGTSGSRNSVAAFGELNLPVLKSLELQTALRTERYSDFGNATTGKLGFKWSPLPSTLAFRGTAGTGFRAPSISQIGDSYMSSFHSYSVRQVIDPLRCDPVTLKSKADPANNRDCNVLGRAANSPNPGSIPTTISANRNLKPEKSNSFTLGLLAAPHRDLDFALDLWYYHRKDEVRVERGVDIMDRYTADRSNADQVMRDPNPETWVAGVPNSGPILMLIRRYGNYNWTKTSGVDYDVNFRIPTTDYGRFTLKLNGTYVKRFDYKVLSGDSTTYAAGTTDSDMSKTKAKLTLDWDGGDWKTYLRLNHQDKLKASTTNACLTSNSAPNVLLRENQLCYVTPNQTLDAGVTYRGIKGLSLSLSVLNLTNRYGFTLNGPAAPGYYDDGAAAMVGRRVTLGASYDFY